MINNGWQLSCDEATFQVCRKDPRFAYIVALSRSINALNSAHALLLAAAHDTTPKGFRNRMNGYFFICSVLYEIIGLIGRMSSVFKGDPLFENELRMVLRYPGTQEIKDNHLKEVRHGAVFHFLPEYFEEIITGKADGECVFARADGPRHDDIDYFFADSIAAEMYSGVAEGDPNFASTVMNSMQATLSVVIEFTERSEKAISSYLIAWGFKMKPL